MKAHRIILAKRLVTVAPILLFATVGAYLVFGTQAQSGCDDGVCVPAVANPALTSGCKEGLDIALLYDASGSMQDSEFAIAKSAMRSFVNALNGKPMSYAINKMHIENDEDSGDPFTQNTAQALARINAAELGGGSEIGNLSWITASDPRPNKQNLVIVLSDFKLSTISSTVNTLKQNGTRFLAMEINDGAGGGKGDEYIRSNSTYTGGPSIDTGSIFTSDVVTFNFNTIGAQFANFAQQLCNPPGNGPGTGGTGAGVGIGGTGAGTNGTGQGQTPGNGTGGGSSGATATKVGDTSNSLPSPTGQGNATEQPRLEPSPFFDGRTYAPGSDPIDKALGNLSIGGKRIIHGWAYLLGLFFVIGNLVAGYFLWWRRMPTEQQAVWRSRLHLRN